MSKKRTFQDFKTAVANASKRYPSLKRRNGRFNVSFLKAAYKSKMSAVDTCNSMTEVT